ncbi:hypothetical protein K504DRAFT_276447 [Pleomassaria siparia CBS 279.74]|uniref:G-protein coupled receptors family 2 profile 2 domain-containing protein n=1 Tax=Pleomassaria siparia CBS 279.74 TaxID=1314801 RepID=A0A6G1KAF8_9PLEO|nr:hypothetical protein K504DRAFT_276447 [Pleomassaria siparia CBS 279.74]
MLAATKDQLFVLKVAERTMSCLSLLGSLFIMVTFIRWRYFRKPINRLVFFASFGNVCANVATLISIDALPKYQGHLTSLCEFQGVLIQWFMVADSLWVFCMALNVMLVFFYNYGASQLRRLETWYMLFSYGVPAVPASVYIIIDHYGSFRVMGSATIWCWVGPQVEWMRIAFFYMPVWVILSATIIIYTITGRKIFYSSAELRSFSRYPDEFRSPRDKPPVVSHRGIKIQKEFSVHSSAKPAPETPARAYGLRDSLPSTGNLTPPTPSLDRASRTSTPSSKAGTPSETAKRKKKNKNCSYRCEISAPASAAVDLESGLHRTRPANHTLQLGRPGTHVHFNKAAMSYFKVAFLMFAALFIVWVPSTINRVWHFVNKENSYVFGLNVASALVLPLQGFWNAMIYISTTWPECKRAFAETTGKKYHSASRPNREDSQHKLTLDDIDELDPFGGDIPLKVMLNQSPRKNNRSHVSNSSTE